jgi:hypothetical protein
MFLIPVVVATHTHTRGKCAIERVECAHDWNNRFAGSAGAGAGPQRLHVDVCAAHGRGTDFSPRDGTRHCPRHSGPSLFSSGSSFFFLKYEARHLSMGLPQSAKSSCTHAPTLDLYSDPGELSPSGSDQRVAGVEILITRDLSLTLLNPYISLIQGGSDYLITPLQHNGFFFKPVLNRHADVLHPIACPHALSVDETPFTTQRGPRTEQSSGGN